MNTINGRIQTKKKNITIIASMAEALTADMVGLLICPLLRWMSNLQ